jgi:hypothetical protein
MAAVPSRSSERAIERHVRRIALSVNSLGASGYDVLVSACNILLRHCHDRNCKLTLTGSQNRDVTPLDCVDSA